MADRNIGFLSAIVSDMYTVRSRYCLYNKFLQMDKSKKYKVLKKDYLKLLYSYQNTNFEN